MKNKWPYIVFTLLIPIGAAVLFYWRFLSTTNDIDPNMHYLVAAGQEQNDILFVGNSHTFYQIDPRAVQDSTGRKAYNLGLEGVSMVYYNMVYRTYMQRHPAPKYLVINIDHRCFNTDVRVFNFPDYFPYIKDSMVSACLTPYCPEYRYSISQFYYRMMRVNARPDPSKLSNLHYLFSPGNDILPIVDSLRGFHPFAIKWENKRHDVIEYHAVCTGLGVDMLRDIIRDAGAHGIKVILIATPQYRDYRQVIRNYDALIDTCRHMAAEAHIPLWDYTDISMTQDRDNYYNIEHLNAQGAAIYSRMLAGDLRRYLVDSAYVPDIKRVYTQTP
jgi:hypothetical protein